MELINIKHNLQIHCCSGQAVPGQITLCLCLNLRRVLSLRLWYCSVLPLDSNAKTVGGERILFVRHKPGRLNASPAEGFFQSSSSIFPPEIP